MAATELPAAIAQLASALADLPGVEAVVLGGSRATGEHRPDSDWDLGLYYRASHGSFDPAALRGLGHEGHVSALGEWGPIVHGGAWLTVDGLPVDVIFRDLDTVERWLWEAEAGRFEVLVQNGSIVGTPTYAPVGELAICQPISGRLPRPPFPDALAAGAVAQWSGRASVSLMFATTYAAAGDGVCCLGMLVDAALCTAHARLAERREWALNEKRLLQRAGLGDLQRLITPAALTAPAAGEADLSALVAAVSATLRVDALRAR